MVNSLFGAMMMQNMNVCRDCCQWSNVDSEGDGFRAVGAEVSMIPRDPITLSDDD